MLNPPFKCRLHCRCISKLISNITRVKREIPMIFELLVTLFILCILLISDVIWLGYVHSGEVVELDRLHGKDLDRFRKQFDAQMHAVKSKQIQQGVDLEKAHVDHVNKLKMSHQEELDKKINSILTELDSLKSLSKNYWERHAEQYVDPELKQDKENGNR